MTIQYELPSLAPRRAPREEPHRQESLDEAALSSAETADCTCPDFCERDHDNE